MFGQQNITQQCFVKTPNPITGEAIEAALNLAIALLLSREQDKNKVSGQIHISVLEALENRAHDIAELVNRVP